MAPLPPWSDLPPELLAIIAKSLGSNPIDIFCFRTICKSWFSSIARPPLKLSPIFPLRSPLPPSPLSHHFLGASCIFYVSAIYVIRPTRVPINDSSSTPKSWIFFVDQLNPGKVSLREPFSRSNMFAPLNFPRSINFLDFNISELARYYSISSINDRGTHMNRPPKSPEEILKVIFSSNESGMFLLFNDGKLWFVMLVRDNDAICRWETIHDGKGFCFDDIINYKGKVLGVNRRGQVYELSHYSSPVKVIRHQVPAGRGMRKRLIESLGVLHLVARCGDSNTSEGIDEFKVYILNEQTGKWNLNKNTNDQTFFFGVDFSFAASAEQLGVSYATNSIIFGEHSFRRYDRKHSDAHLFTELVPGDHLRVGIFRFEVGSQIRAIQSDLGCSRLLWPPPTWICPNRRIIAARYGFQVAGNMRLIKVLPEGDSEDIF